MPLIMRIINETTIIQMQFEWPVLTWVACRLFYETDVEAVDRCPSLHKLS